MPCSRLIISHADKSRLAVLPIEAGRASVEAQKECAVDVTPKQKGRFSVTPVRKGSLAVTPLRKGSMAIGMVCSVGSGTLVVLAGSDGPLRTRDGGYILLDPDRN